MKVEQYTLEGSGKAFCLLLHYPPSSPLHVRCYPALFLGGWNHIFLDSVGDNSGMDMSTHISHACCNVAPTATEYDKFIHQLQTLLLPRILPQLLSQNLFYRDQELFQRNSFLERKVCLARLLATKINSASIELILCQKFAKLWFDQVLLRATSLASKSLSQGLTQLSLSMSIHSTLVGIFQLFLSDVLVQANQWRNFDIIASTHGGSSRDNHMLALFEMVLQNLPVLPIEELVLQRRNVLVNRLIPQPINRLCLKDNQFPFFQLVSSFLDELVESIGLRMRRDSSFATNSKNFSNRTCACEILEQAMDLLLKNDSTEQTCQRSALVHSVISYVCEHSSNDNESSNTLFRRYLRQYIEWKLGCSSNRVFLQWWSVRIKSLLQLEERNILAIHVVGWVEEPDIMKISSFISSTDSFLRELEIDPDESLLSACDICDALLGYSEKALIQHQFNPKRIRWSFMLSTASVSMISNSGKVEHERLAKRLRGLGFAFLHNQLNIFDSSHTKDGMMEQYNTSLQSFLDSATRNDDKGIAEVLLHYFLSPVWLDISPFFLQEDLNYLFDAIDKYDIDHSTAVGLLRSASRHNSSAHSVPNCSLNFLLSLCERLTTDDVVQFTEEGKRCSLQIFIPEWLRVESHNTQATVECTSSLRFIEYRNTEHKELVSVVFDFFLSQFVMEATYKSSEEIFLSLERALNTEFMLQRQEYTKLARMRKFGSGDSLKGTLVSAIAISARLVCFVAKVAFEVAIDMNASVLNGTYANEAASLCEELMTFENGAKWQEFFMSTILRLRGDGTLTEAVEHSLSLL